MRGDIAVCPQTFVFDVTVLSGKSSTTRSLDVKLQPPTFYPKPITAIRETDRKYSKC